MENRLTKVAAIAIAALTAAAPMAMASSFATGTNASNLSVSVAPIGAQPKLTKLPASALELTPPVPTVRVEALGPQPRMPFAQMVVASNDIKSSNVTAGNLSKSAQLLR